MLTAYKKLTAVLSVLLDYGADVDMMTRVNNLMKLVIEFIIPAPLCIFFFYQCTPVTQITEESLHV